MIILCTERNDVWLSGFIQYFFAPFVVAAVSYYLFGLRDEYKKRKNYSKLGVELISTLIEEVETGRDIIRNTLDPANNKFFGNLPHKSWSGINTIQDEILLRIFAVSEGIPEQGFPARQIRTHLKNYFEHLIPNWETIHTSGVMANVAAQRFASYDKLATQVLQMLAHIRSLLEQNTNRIFPK
jgi:enamine deaminase RidA (YjgF/YER057c/UK114 family)